jgi:hypothetical protein
MGVLLSQINLKSHFGLSKLTMNGPNQMLQLHQYLKLSSQFGDDAVVLVYKGTPVDRFGRIGERPETGWGTAVSSNAAVASILKAEFSVSIRLKLFPKLETAVPHPVSGRSPILHGQLGQTEMTFQIYLAQ